MWFRNVFLNGGLREHVYMNEYSGFKSNKADSTACYCSKVKIYLPVVVYVEVDLIVDSSIPEIEKFVNTLRSQFRIATDPSRNVKVGKSITLEEFCKKSKQDFRAEFY